MFRGKLMSAIEFIFVFVLLLKSALCDIEYNNLNSDGSFSFRHSNNDIGSYYHSVAGNPDNNIRGRYGSRNPSNGRVEETVYTAGPRGFRVNGPQVHRKMDLSQIPRRPIGNADDPLADPYDDPTNSFSFKTTDYSRDEDTDSSGRVRGLYSYFDDIGEKHTVRYAAGAGTGFKVLNSVPDSQSSAAYTAPLYKATAGARGKVAVQRGSNGLYKFIATAPDHRRTEVSGPDGVVRGAYSYLDDKGIQRTVEYEAGAGIGYRIIKNSIGRGTHVHTLIPNLDVGDVASKEYLQVSNFDQIDTSYSPDITGSKGFRKPKKNTKSAESKGTNSNRGVMMSKNIKGIVKTTSRDENSSQEDENNDSDLNIFSITNTNKMIQDQKRRRNKTKNRINNVSFDENLSSIPPIITSNRRILEIGREKDWSSQNRDSTIITNVGKWYIGLPPGQSVRAHVQNIDILPIGGRTLSPSEALRRDELSERSDI